MNKKREKAKPVDIESKFFVDELFFSSTDFIGNILTGNSVFVRVSQYEKEEIIGAPHNIIRHPDMPKIVFKVLWDYIKAKRTVVAYVKNLTKEGRYYWVLATVFPMSDGYVSIRIKPTSKFFALIPDVYQKLLEVEKSKDVPSEGMDASLAQLLKILKSKGFNDYDSFMTAVLMEELSSRQHNIKTSKELSDFSQEISENETISAEHKSLQSVFDTFKEVKGFCHSINSSFNNLFKSFELLLSIEDILSKNSTEVLTFSEDISTHSLNADIESYRVGVKGRTLSVIAKSIKVKSEEISSFTHTVVDIAREVVSRTQELEFQTATPRLQSDMIDFFVKELLINTIQGKIENSEIDEAQENIVLLVNLFVNTFSHLNETLLPLKSKIDETIHLINSINKYIKELERTYVVGNIEASRIGDQGKKFVIIFDQINESTETTKQRLQGFYQYLVNVLGAIDAINQSNAKILKYVNSIKTLIHQLNRTKGNRSQVNDLVEV
ncbi:MAG: PAS domain-containing protein [Candidatus Omnitrophica bacterium]|nr:PAS domain-containing protein [Candidatus Omnitrophota bacterium]